MNRILKSVYVLLFCLGAGEILPAMVYAGIENRPLNTSEAALLESGRFSLAAGAKYLKAGSEKEYSLVTDWEYGFLNSFELDLEVPFTSFKPAGTGGNSGLGDAALWLGYALGKEGKAAPAVAAAFSWKTATGSQEKGLGTGENTYQGTVLISKTFGKTSVHFNGSYTFADAPVIGYNLALKQVINDKLTLVAELYDQKDQKVPGNNTTDGLIGAIYAVSPSASLDLGAGRGFTAASADLRLTGGITLLW